MSGAVRQFKDNSQEGEKSKNGNQFISAIAK
jgi:hypothetical protein